MDTSDFNPDNRRVVIAVMVVLFVFGLIGLRMFYLQVLQGFFYTLKAQNLSIRQIEVEAPRGKIYDRNGQLLATNNDFFSINIIPIESGRSNVARVLEQLKKNFNISQSIIDRQVPPTAYNSYQSIELKDGFDLNTITYLAENLADYPGVSWASKPKRVYVNDGGIGSGATVSHILGYVGNISAIELQLLYNKGYRRNDIIGKSGIEKQYDGQLKGVTGVRSVLVDAQGRRQPNTETLVQSPMNGNDIYLTVDIEIQKLAEEALGDRRGTVIVMKAETGEILAMVSNPVFRANLFDKGGNTSFAMQSIDPNFPFINRAIAAEYPAASPFKVVGETALLANNAVDPNFKVLCTGSIRVGDRVFRCHLRSGHGWQNLSEALANSCNIYFATMIKDNLAKDIKGNADPEKLALQAFDFGYGNLTEIDIPNEKSGLIPTKAWKEETFHDGWRIGDTVNMAIGQGFVLVTPLQVANAMALAANRGVSYKPHFLKEIRNPEGEVIFQKEKEVLHNSDVKTEVWERLNQDLRGVTLKGTGWMLNKVATVAGKTGTGEVGVDGSYHDWYVGYAPFEQDRKEERIVVAVQIESTNTYQWWSSKTADMIIQGFFAGQNYKEAVKAMQAWYVPNWWAL